MTTTGGTIVRGGGTTLARSGGTTLARGGGGACECPEEASALRAGARRFSELSDAPSPGGTVLRCEGCDGTPGASADPIGGWGAATASGADAAAGEDAGSKSRGCGGGGNITPGVELRPTKVP